MHQPVRSARLAPLPPNPALREELEATRKSLGFIPNSLLIMQRWPRLVRAWVQMLATVWDPESTVDRGFKRLLAHVVSRAAGCQYCMAHTAGGAEYFGVPEAKIAAVWEYGTSPLYSDAERIALDVAVGAASVPNAVTEEMFVDLRKFWREEQIVEIVAVISVFGFLNRWNDTMGTPLEEEPLAAGARYLTAHGWSPGKHGR